jgi:hypothetical protein
MSDCVVVITLLIAVCPLLMLAVLSLRRVEGLSPVEIGVVFSAVTTVYALLPLTGYVLSGFNFDLSIDARVPELSSSPKDVMPVAMLHLLFLFGFCLVYGLFRPRRRGFAPGDVVVGDWRLPAVLALFAACAVVLPFVVKAALGVESSQDYIGTYLEMVGQPLWIQQIYGVIQASSSAVVIAALVAAFAFRGRLIFIGAAMAAGLTLFTIAAGGSRTMAMVTLLSLVVSYALIVRRISVGRAAVLGALLIFVFGLGQFLRDFAANEDVSTFAGALVNGEFASLFINGLDILQQRDWLIAQGMLPNLYTVDVARFAPQQILPFDKVDPSRWYIETLYPAYAESGGGLAFGAVAEAAAGSGPIEALIRGLLLGSLFAMVQSVASRPGLRSLVALVAYTWLVVFCYQSLRDTSFSIVARFVYNAVPALVLVKLVEIALSPLKYSARAPSANTGKIGSGKCAREQQAGAGSIRDDWL